MHNHGRWPGLNKVRQMGVWGDIPPAGVRGQRVKGVRRSPLKLTPFC